MSLFLYIYRISLKCFEVHCPCIHGDMASTMEGCFLTKYSLSSWIHGRLTSKHLHMNLEWYWHHKLRFGWGLGYSCYVDGCLKKLWPVLPEGQRVLTCHRGCSTLSVSKSVEWSHVPWIRTSIRMCLCTMALPRCFRWCRHSVYHFLIPLSSYHHHLSRFCQ